MLVAMVESITNSGEQWVQLRSALALNAPDSGPVIEALGRVWNGDQGTKMATHKLSRMENANWSHPVLSFDVERHGATVMGSVHAEVQHWIVNVDAETIEQVGSQQRRLKPSAPPFDVTKPAKECARIVVDGGEHPGITRLPNGTVRVSAAPFLPAGNKQTLQARVKRFTAALRAELEARGWSGGQGGVWRPDHG
jgi:hypothetical protein